MRRLWIALALALAACLAVGGHPATADAARQKRAAKKRTKKQKKARATAPKAPVAVPDVATVGDKIEAAAQVPEGEEEPPDELESGLDRWRGNEDLVDGTQSFTFASKAWKRFFDQRSASVQEAKRIAGGDLAAPTLDALARVLFVLEMEAPANARAFRGRLQTATRQRGGKAVPVAKVIERQASFYRELYAVPCRGAVSRVGMTWPPVYACREKALPPTREPLPLITLSATPQVVPPTGEIDPKRVDPKTSAALAEARRKLIEARDAQAMPTEALGHAPPGQFCHRGRCSRNYAAVAAAIYGRNATGLPVFCAPKKQGQGWRKDQVDCSGNWLETLGGWKPWRADGSPAAAPEPGALPPYGCLGSPHLLRKHMVLPPGADLGPTGFACRKRVFRVLVKKAEQSVEDRTRNIGQMCSEMRQQVWGEKYADINSEFQKWCRAQKRKDCLPADAPMAGPGSPPLPFTLLSREELLFFFGHRELFCRADRPGLTHFLYNGPWAGTFTCDVPRGLIEAGPFEEGVQTCAVAPFIGTEADSGALKSHHFKARLHCWKFNRPTCEEVSRDQTKDDIHRSNVFDAYDALKEARRTRHPHAWALYDLKDAEKLEDNEDKLSFSDGAKDEGVFGVREFCRFVGSTRRIQCGFDRRTMAQHYELHQDEPPEGCAGGVCARGAYQRGYYCGLFSSKELFAGAPHWMCGIDIGAEGRRILDGAAAICYGGARAKTFLSAKGDKGSLQCYERRYRWGESVGSETLLRQFDWVALLQSAARYRPAYDPWLHGGDQARNAWKKAAKKKHSKKSKKKKKKQGAAAQARERAVAQKALEALVAEDMRELVAWAVRHGHTLGHRTSLRIGLMNSPLRVVKELKALSFPQTDDHAYQALGCTGCTTYRFVARKKKAKKKKAAAARKPKKKRKKKRARSQHKERARGEAKAKALAEMVNEVITGGSAADGRWYQSLRQEATEDGKLRIAPAQLAVALRLHHVFEVLDGARRVLLRHAKAYAKTVLATARKSKRRLARPEVHELARTAPIADRFKGNIFCVGDDQLPGRGGMHDYVCASSPLLVAGMVELELERTLGSAAAKLDAMRRAAQQKLTEETRAKVRFDWCFGGTKGEPLFGSEPSPALAVKEVSSPFFMDVPASVAAGVKDGEVPGVGARSAAHWVKCSTLQYSDERWDRAEPEKQAAPKRKKKKRRGGGKGDALASKVMSMMSSMVNFALQFFSDAMGRVKDLSHSSGDFQKGWLGKFLAKAKTVWKKIMAVIEKVKAVVKRVREKVEDLRNRLHKVELEYASAPPTAKKNLEAKKTAAQQALADARKDLKEAERNHKGELNKAHKNRKISGTGDILGPLLDALIKMVTERVTKVIDPHARKLLNKGFGFVRRIIDPIAQSIIKAIGNIPYVGGALAAAAQSAYSEGLNALEKLAGDALLGIVERIMAKGIRFVAAPLLRLVQDKILEGALAACAASFPLICPQGGGLQFSAVPAKDRWIERALACRRQPILHQRLVRNARIARRQILRSADEMRGQTMAYVRDIADHYLARFGYTYDSWMAAVGSQPPVRLAAVAARVGELVQRRHARRDGKTDRQ